MSSKMLIWILAAFILTDGPFADAQPASKPHRIGYLSSHAGREARFEAFEQGLRELGYVEGKNVIFERRFANASADLYKVKLAQDLVQRGLLASV